MPGPRDAINRWVVIIKRIKQLAAAHERGDPLSIIAPAVLEVLQWADDIPVLKHNTASRLIFSIKVPSKLLATYTLSNCSNSNSPANASCSSSSSSSSAGAPIIGMAVILLLARFCKAAFDGQEQSGSNEVRRLEVELERQLRQAGLEEHLPAIITAAAKAAAAAADDIAATQQEDLQQLPDRRVPADEAAAAARAAAAAAANTKADAATAAATADLGQQCIIGLWELLAILSPCTTPDALVAFLQPLTVPLLQLFVALIQTISRQCEQQQGQDPGANGRQVLRWVLTFIVTRLVEVTRRMNEASQQNHQALVQQYLPLLQSPYCMQVCTLLTVISANALLLSHQPLESLVADATTSSSSSSSSNSAMDEFERHSHPLAAHAWSLARSRQHLLPASHGELLQLMGVSRAGAIWAAAQLNCTPRLMEWLDTIRLLLHTTDALHDAKRVVAGQQALASDDAAVPVTPPAVGAAAAAAAALQQCQLLQDPREQAMQGLLPSVLLHWAFHTPADHPGFADSCMLAAAASCTALEASVGCQQQQQEQQQQEQQPQPQLGQPLSSDLSCWQSYAAEQIGLAMQLLSKLLSEVKSLSGTYTKRSSSSSSSNGTTSLHEHTNSSRSGSSDSSSSGPNPLQQHTDSLHAVATLLTHLLRHPFCSTCVEHNQLRIAHLPTAGACHWRASAGPIWAQRSTQLFTLLEEYVRLDLPGITPGQVCSISALCKPPGLGPSNAGGNFLFTVAAEAGPGSTPQQQYCSLMCSLLKYVGRLQGQQQHQMLVEEVRLLVGHTSLMLTARNVLDPPNQHGSSDTTTNGSSSSRHEYHSPGVACLPWLVLFGRCCTQWVEQHAAEPDVAQQLQQQNQLSRQQNQLLQQRVPKLQQLQQRVQQLLHGPLQRVKGGIAEDMQLFSPNDVLDALNQPNQSNKSNNSYNCTFEYKGLRMPLLAAWGHLLGSSLVAGGLAEVLQAEGYCDLLSAFTKTVMPVYDSVQQAFSKAASLPAEELAPSRSELRATVMAEDNNWVSCEDVQLPNVMQWGLMLTSIATGCACNNPSCSNMAEASELKLVKGSARTCGGCSTARYCGSKCQKQHWQQHKPVCKALAKARSDV